MELFKKASRVEIQKFSCFNIINDSSFHRQRKRQNYRGSRAGRARVGAGEKSFSNTIYKRTVENRRRLFRRQIPNSK